MPTGYSSSFINFVKMPILSFFKNIFYEKYSRDNYSEFLNSLTRSLNYMAFYKAFYRHSTAFYRQKLSVSVDIGLFVNVIRHKVSTDRSFLSAEWHQRTGSMLHWIWRYRFIPQHTDRWGRSCSVEYASWIGKQTGVRCFRMLLPCICKAY